MSERLPFFKEPLQFSVVSRGLRHSLILDFLPKDVLHPYICFDGQQIAGELVLRPMHRGDVQTTNVKLQIQNNGSFVNFKKSCENPKPVEFDLFEFAPLSVSLFGLGNLGIMSVEKKVEIIHVKKDGFFPKISDGDLTTVPVRRYIRKENKLVPEIIPQPELARLDRVFSFKIVDGQVVTDSHKALVVDATSTYDKVTMERKNFSSLGYLVQIIWLINRIKKQEKK